MDGLNSSVAIVAVEL